MLNRSKRLKFINLHVDPQLSPFVCPSLFVDPQCTIVSLSVDVGHKLPIVQIACFWLQDFSVELTNLSALVEHRAVTREVASSIPAGPTLRVFK